MTIDLEKLQNSIDNAIECTDLMVGQLENGEQPINQSVDWATWNDITNLIEAAKLYLASQSKPADGVEGDQNAALNWLNSFDDTVASSQHKDTIRHALQSAAPLQGRVENTKMVLRELIEFYEHYCPSNSKEGSMQSNLNRYKQSLASLGE